MANKYYKDAWKAMQKVKPSSSSSATTAKSYPKQQSDRLSAQLLVNGVENPLEKDTRNSLEKALNLTPDQNFIFDAFEVLGRPQQALFGAVDEGMRTGDWLGGAWKGLSGQKDTSGGQILRGFGVGDDSKGKANLLDPSTWGVDDVLGLGLDIFLDPADWALIPVTGGTSLLAEGASDAAKIASKADNVADAVKLADKAVDSSKQLKSLTDLAFGTAKDVAKKGASVVDDLSGGSLSAVKNQLQSVFGGGSKKISNFIRKNVGIREGAGNDATRQAVARAQNIINELDNALPDIQAKYLNDVNLSELVKDNDSIIDNLYDAFESTKQQDILRASKVNRFSDLFYKAQGGSGFTKSTPEIRDYLGKAYKTLTSSNLDKDDEFLGLADTIRQALNNNSNYIIFDDDSLSKIDNLASQFSSTLGKDSVNSLTKGLTLDANSPQMQLWNAIKKDYPDLYDKLDSSFKTISKGIDDDLSKTLGMGNTVENAIGDFKGITKAGEETGQYGSYARTRTLDDISDILKRNSDTKKGIESGLGNFTDRQSRIMDTATINKGLKELSEDELGQLFSDFSEDDVKELYDVIQEKGFYDRDFKANIMDVAQNLPSAVANKGLKKDIVLGLGLDNSNQQVNILKSIRDETKKLKSNDLTDEARKAIEGNITKYKEQLNKLYNDAIIRPVTKTKNLGYHAVSVSDIENAFDLVDDKSFKKLINNIKAISGSSNEILLDNRVYHMLNLNKNSDKATNAFLDMIDKMNNLFRRNKLLSPGYNIRNITGNAFNMYVAGVPANQIPSLMANSTKTYILADEAIKRMAKGELLRSMPAEMQEAYDKIVRLEQYGFGDLRKIATEVAGAENIDQRLLSGLSNPISDAVDKINQANLDLNIKVDNISRLAMMEFAESNPQYLTKMGFKDAGEAIAYSLFDPTDLTDVEKNVLRKVVPFYTFTKKNLAFQMDNIFKNSTKYHRVLKAIDSAWGDDENVSDYYKTGLSIPLGYNKDGTRTVFNANLPLSDLIEWTSNPLQRATSSLTPLIRAPFEIATNQQLFTGRPISNFEGEQSDLLNRLPMANLLPDFIDNTKTEYLMSQLGIDVPLKTALNIGELGGSLLGMSDNSVSQNLLNTLGVFGTNDPSKVQLSKEFDELQKLQDYVDYLEQEGVNLQTVTEFENTNKGRINSELQAQIDALLGRTTTSTSNNDAIAWTTKK